MCCECHYMILFVGRQSPSSSQRLMGLFLYYLKLSYGRRMVIETPVSVGVGRVEEPFQNGVSKVKRNMTVPDLFPFTVSCPGFRTAN